MFNKPLIKYTLIFITVIVAGFGVYKTIESIVSVKIELDISIYSDCLPLSDAEVSFDGKLKGTTNSSGNIQFKINYDNDKPEKQVKISVGGQQWMEGIILKEENIGKTQERIIFFRQPSTDVMITPFPENISYSIMDMDTKCELYANQIGLSVKRMIIDRPYRIKYSLDPEYNSHVFSSRFKPIGIEDEIKLTIFELNIITDPDELSYEIAENGTTFEVGFGTGRYYFKSKKNLVIKPNKGEHINVHLKDEWKYVKRIKGQKITQSCSNSAEIRVSNPSAQWKIINSQTNDMIYSGQGDEPVGNLCFGKHLLKETGSSPDLREKEFIITKATPDHYVNLDLNRWAISVVPYPNSVKWEISKNRKSILKNGTGSSKVTGLIPGSYTARCKRPDGSQTRWKNFELINNDQLVELDCFVACTSPQINIQLTPASVSWELEESDGKSPYVSFKSGHGVRNIKAQLGQLYRLTARHNNMKRVSDVLSFTSLHKTCRETIDIKMESHVVLLDEACNNNDWEQVVTLTANVQNALECNHYSCLAQAYSNAENHEKALDFILDGWNQVNDKHTCLDFHTDDQYIFNLLLLAEKYGLDDDHIAEKNIQNKIDTIIEIPLQPKTELKAVYVYLTLKISDINKKRKIWTNSDQSFRTKNEDDYCGEINDFRDGPYSIERIKYLMNLVGNFMYKTTVYDVFLLDLERASKTFGCQ